jgi:hypothetical protein
VIGDGLAATNIEIVHHQMDLASKGIGRHQILHHLGELRR